MRSVSHPTWFVKKEMYERRGLYSAHKIAMDYDMMCRIRNEKYRFINRTIAIFDNTGRSSLNYIESLKENIKVYEFHFGVSIFSRFWQFRLKILHRLLQTGVGKRLYSLKKKMGLENL